MLAMLMRRSGKTAEGNPCSSASDFMTCLYQKYKAVLYQKAGAYTPDPCAREDIVQEALLRLVHNAARLETLDPPALMSYMTLTVRSAALNYLRAEHRERLDAVPKELDEKCLRLIKENCASEKRIQAPSSEGACMGASRRRGRVRLRMVLRAVAAVLAAVLLFCGAYAANREVQVNVLRFFQKLDENGTWFYFQPDAMGEAGPGALPQAGTGR